MSVALYARDAAAIGDDAAILARIDERDTHLALWRRPRPAQLAWIDRLNWPRIDSLAFPAAIGSLDREVDEGLTEAGYPDEHRVSLCEDVATLARRFATIMRCDAVSIRLEVIETDACRRFHADHVTARLLTTYHGPGTHWCAAADPAAVHQLAPGDVALLKGRQWADEPAILHRSPPIEATGATRLVLAIDQAPPH